MRELDQAGTAGVGQVAELRDGDFLQGIVDIERPVAAGYLVCRRNCHRLLGTRNRVWPEALGETAAASPSYLVQAALPELYREGAPRHPDGRSIARMVAVQKAQSCSEVSSLLKPSTMATPIEPDICNVFARAISSLPSAGGRKFTFNSTVTPIRPLGRPEVTATPAA